MKKIIVRILLASSFIFVTGNVFATPIQFSFWGTGTGSVGQVGFTGTAFTIDLFADTNNITGSGTKWLVADNASFSVSGVGSGNITDTLQMFGNSFGTGLSKFFDLIEFVNTPGLKLYDLASSTAVFTETSPCCVGSFTNIATDMGPLGFTGFGNVSFQATTGNGQNTVPEPAPLALLGLGLLGLGLLRKRRG